MKQASVPSILVAVVLFALGVKAEAQHGKAYRVGLLAPPGKVEERVVTKALRDGLRQIGYAEG